MRILGFIVMLCGVALQPVGWMYVQWLTIVSFVLIALGVFLLVSARGDAAGGGGGVGGDDGSPRLTGRELPGDVHGYSGQMSGARSTSWESSHADHGGGSGD